MSRAWAGDVTLRFGFYLERRSLMEQKAADVDVVDSFVKLTLRKRQLTEDLGLVNKQLKTVKAQIIEQFLQVDRQSINQSGYLVGLKRTVSGSSVNGDTEMLTEALLGNGLKFLLSPQWQKLGSWCREIEEVDESTGLPVVPKGLEHALKISERVDVTCSKR